MEYLYNETGKRLLIGGRIIKEDALKKLPKKTIERLIDKNVIKTKENVSTKSNKQEKDKDTV